MKNLLLAGGAVAALLTAGAANASDLTYRTTTSTAMPGGAAAFATDIDGGVTGSGTSPYLIAAESNTITSVGNDLALTLDLSGTSTLPSTDVTLTINLVGNAVFGTGGIQSADITGASTCASFTVVPVSGGAAGSQSAVFIVSNSASDCSGLNIDLPVALTSAAAGDVTVNTTLAVGSTPIDPPQGSLVAIRVANAFAASLTADTPNVAATSDTVILNASGAFTTFSTVGGNDSLIGTAAVTRVANTYRNLTIANVTADADITNVDVDVTASAAVFGPTNLASGGSLASLASNLTTTTANADSNAAGVGTITLSLDDTPSGAIPPSTFTGLVTTTLVSGYTPSAAPTASGSLQPIRREGVTVIVPWIASATRAGTGSTNNVRISNNGGAASAVYAEVINTRNAGGTYVPAIAPVLLGTIAAGTSANWTSTALEAALGDFGQADIRITVNGGAATTTIKRTLTTADGGTTELSLGHAGDDVSNSN